MTADPTPIRPELGGAQAAGGGSATRDAILDALDHPQDAPQMAQAGDIGPELQHRERPPFPPGCPVTPLGIESDVAGTQKCFYLNWNGQLVGLEANNRHGKLGLIALFGPASDWLEAHWPKYSAPVREQQNGKWVVVREPVIVGFDQAEAARALIEECVRRGPFDAAGKLRGPGAHAQRGGGLVLHCGDKLLVSRHYATTGEFRDWIWIDPGLHEGYVYTAKAAIPRPAHDPVHPRVAEKLLATFRTWNWRRELLDPRLLLGGVGASLLGGKLEWRPHLWITGGAGTGKSTLNGKHKLLHQLFGDGLFRTANTSAAGLRQRLLNSTVPVMLDELEASGDNRKVNEIVELARIASSGDDAHRGGQDHQAHEFTLQSCFWASSILIPPMETQDRSRFAFLELKPLRADAVPPDLEGLHLAHLGQQLLRLMIDGFTRLGPTKLKFHAALAAVGHTPRACDQFGTLLACADLLLHDRPGPPDDEEVAHWAHVCRPDKMAEISDEVPDHLRCLHHVLTAEVQARGGDERQVLGTWIGEAVAYVVAPLLERSNPKCGDERADKRLQQMGLKLVNARRKPGGGWGAVAFEHQEPGFLAVADSHQALGKLFAGQKWQGGVWKQSLGRCDGAIERVDVKFGHVKSRAVLVPLWLVLEDEELPNASRRAAAEGWLAGQMAGGEG